MIVTEDDERHTIAPSPAAVSGLLALARADAILLWDPTNRTLIAANIIGTWLEETPTGVTPAADRLAEPHPQREAGISRSRDPRPRPT